MAKDDIDFDNFDFDNFDNDPVSPGNGTNSGDKKRAAITEVPLSFAKGALSTLTERGNIRRFVNEAMPEGYGTVYSTASEIGGELKQLYNEAAHQIAPAMPMLRKVAGKLSEKQRFFIPKSIQEKLQEFSKGTDNQGFIESQEKQDNDLIASSMAELFQTQMEQSAAQERNTEVREAIRDQVQNQQHQTLAQLMEATRAATARVSAFNDQVFSRYMQKDLELQYRQYFAQRDMLKTMLRREQTDSEYFKAIARNTGLPEYRKIKLSEVAGQSFRDRMVNGVQKSAANFAGNFIRNVGKNARGAVNGVLGSIMGGLEMGQSGYDMLKQQEEMNREMEQMGMKVESKSSMAANMAGSMMGDFLMPFITGPMRKLLGKNQKLVQKGAKYGNIARSLPEMIQNWARTSDSGENKWHTPLLWMLKDIIPKFSLDRSLGESPLVAADQAATFNNLTQRSIVEIIPGYLSRIHRELVAMRTGDDSVEPITYNMDRGQFTTTKDATRDAAKRIIAGPTARMARDEIDSLTEQLLGDRAKDLKPDQLLALRKQLLVDASENAHFTLERYTGESSNTRHLDRDTRDALSGIIHARFAGEDGEVDHRKISTALRSYHSLRSYYPNPQEMMKVYRDSGNADAVRALGLVKRNGFSEEVDFDRFNDILLAGKHEYLDDDAFGRVESTEPDAERPRWNPLNDPEVHDRWTERVTGAVENFNPREAWKNLSTKSQAEVARMLDMSPRQLADEGLAGYNRLSRKAKRRWQKAFLKVLRNEGVAGARDQAGKAKGWLEGKWDKLRNTDSFKNAQGRAQAAWGRVQNSTFYKSSAQWVDSKRKELTKQWKAKGGAGFAKSIRGMSDEAQEATRKRLSEILNKDITLREMLQSGRKYIDKLQPAQLASVAQVAAEAEAAANPDLVTSESVDVDDTFVAREGSPLPMGVSPTATDTDTNDDDTATPATPAAPVAAEPAPPPTSSIVQRMRDLIPRRPAASFTEAAASPAEQITVEAVRAGVESAQPIDPPGLLDINHKQLESLIAIHEAILAQGSGGGGTGDAPKPSFLRRMFGSAGVGVGKVGSFLGKGLKPLAKLYGKYSLGVIKAPFKVAGFAGRVGWNMLAGFTGSSKQIVDVYVVGEKEVRLKKRKLMAGDYRDAKTQRPIRTVKDIKGPVYDITAKDESPVITEADIQAGFYTLKDGKPSPLKRIGRTALSALGTVASAYGAMFKLPFMATKAAAKVMGWAWDKITTGKMDVYVKGQADPSTPRLRAVLMDGQNYFTEKGKGVTSIRQLNGQRIYAADRTTLLIGPEDYQKGLVNARGKKLETGLMKIGNILGNVVGGVAVGASRMVGGLARGIGTIAGGAYRAMGSVIGSAGRAIGRMFGFKAGWLNASPDQLVYKQTQLLEAIHDMLDNRLPGRKLRKGSWEEQMANAKSKLAEGAKGVKERAKGAWGAILDKGKNAAKGLMSLLGLGGDDEDEDGSDGGTTINHYGGGGDGDKKAKDGKSKSKGKRKKGGKSPRGGKAKLPKGKAGLFARALQAGGAGWGKLKGLLPGGAKTASAAKTASTASKMGGFLSKGKNFIGNPAKMLGTLALMYGGGKVLDATLGKDTGARKAASTAGDVASTALTASWLSGLVGGPTLTGLGSSALGAVGLGGGGAAATAAGATAAASTAAAGTTAAAGAGGIAAGVGGGALLTVGLPIAAAAAAIGYVGYKAWKKYKYGTFTVPRAYRMAQYGIPYSDSSMVEKIVDFEQMCEPHVAAMNGGHDLKASKDFDMQKVYKHFGIDEGWFSSRDKQRASFDLWFNRRFKPVFLAYQSAMRNPGPAPAGKDGKPVEMGQPCTQVNELDDASPAMKQAVLRGVRGVDPSVYLITAGPDGDELTIGPDQIQDIYLKSERDLKEQLEGGKVGKFIQFGDRMMDSMIETIPGAKMLGLGKFNDWIKSKRDKLWGRSTENMTSEDVAKMIGDDSTKGGSAGYKNVTVSAASSVGLVATGRLTALQSLRMRVYGLTNLTTEKVQAVLALERAVLEKVRIDGDGKVAFTGDMMDYFRRYSPMFGVSANDEHHTNTWSTWFRLRFLASFMTYLSSAVALTGGSSVDGIDGKLKPDQKYQAALAMTHAKISESASMSVWEVYTSPWNADEKLTSDPKTANGPLETLKADRKDGMVDEEKATGIDARVKKSLSGVVDPKVDAEKSTWQKTKDWLFGTGNGDSLFARSMEGLKVSAMHAGVAAGQLAHGDFSGALQSATAAVTAPARYTLGVGVPEPKISASGKKAEATLLRAALAAGISDKTELAMLLAQCAHETGGFRLFSEGVNYKPETAMRLWPKKFGTLANAKRIAASGPTAIMDFAYGSRMGNSEPGDGSRFRGRGFIQLTGRSNYTSFAKASGIDVISHPEQIAGDLELAAKATLHWWMVIAGNRVRKPAQAGDIVGATKAVNGGTNGLEERRSYFNKYMRIFATQSPDQYLASLDGGASGKPEPAPASADDAPAAKAEGASTTSTTSAAPALTNGSPLPSGPTNPLGERLAATAGPMAAASAGGASTSVSMPSTVVGSPLPSGPSADTQYGYRQVTAQVDSGARAATAQTNANTKEVIGIHSQQLDVQRRMEQHLAVLVDYARKTHVAASEDTSGGASDGSADRAMRGAEAQRRKAVASQQVAAAQAPTGGISLKRKSYV